MGLTTPKEPTVLRGCVERHGRFETVRRARRAIDETLELEQAF